MRQRIKKTLFMSLGVLFILLALVGVFLPLLPTTPFVILAALFFSKSSERWHQWLLQNKLFGPLLHDWEESRCMPLFAKKIAYSMMALFGTLSVITLSALWLKVITVLLIGYAYYFLLNLKTCLKETEQG